MIEDCRQRETAAAFVLGALTPHERDDFEAHLATCRACRREVDRLDAGAHALLVAPDPVAPPPELKERLMATVRADAELLRAASGRDADRVRHPRRFARPLLAAAAFAAAVVVAVLAIDGGSGSDVKTVAATTTVPGVRAHVEVRGSTARLVMTGLRRLRAGKVYEVWVKRGSAAPEPSGTFFAVADHGATTEEVHAGVGSGDQVMLTVEPAPGSEAPTTDPVVTATLT